MSQPLFADDIRFYQRVLKIAGLYTDEVDGKWGPNTDAADKAFTAQYESIRNELGAFDPRSEGNIRTLLPVAQRAAREFLARAAAGMPGHEVRILSGTRTYAEQDQLFAKGRNGNPVPIVTHAKAGESNHNFGIAWDVGLFDDGRYLAGDTPAETQLYRDLAKVALIDTLEWGGSWTSFTDLPHYQMKTTLTLAQIQQRFEAGTAIV